MHVTVYASDQELVLACRQGIASAQERLYTQHQRRVAAIVSRIVGVSDAEEVIQEVFIKVYRALPGFRGDSQLSTWIYRMAVNTALTYLGRRKRRAEVSTDELPLELAAEPRSRDVYLEAHLTKALAALPVGYRTVLVLHDVEGLSHEECAQILDCSEGTCKSQLHKARLKMRQLLEATR